MISRRKNLPNTSSILSWCDFSKSVHICPLWGHINKSVKRISAASFFLLSASALSRAVFGMVMQDFGRIWKDRRKKIKTMIKIKNNNKNLQTVLFRCRRSCSRSKPTTCYFRSIFGAVPTFQTSYSNTWCLMNSLPFLIHGFDWILHKNPTPHCIPHNFQWHLQAPRFFSSIHHNFDDRISTQRRNFHLPIQRIVSM